MNDTPGHDPSAAWREVRLQAGPDARPASGPSTRTVRIRRIRGERAAAATGLDGSWLTGRAAETLVSGGRVPTAGAEAARTADRLAGLLAAAGPRHGAGAAALDPEREEAALAAFRAARSAVPKGRARPLARCFGGPRRPRPALRSVRVAAAALASVLALGGVAVAVAARGGAVPSPGGGSGASPVSSTPASVGSGSNVPATGGPGTRRRAAGPAAPCVTPHQGSGSGSVDSGHRGGDSGGVGGKGAGQDKGQDKGQGDGKSSGKSGSHDTSTGKASGSAKPTSQRSERSQKQKASKPQSEQLKQSTESNRSTHSTHSGQSQRSGSGHAPVATPSPARGGACATAGDPRHGAAQGGPRDTGSRSGDSRYRGSRYRTTRHHGRHGSRDARTQQPRPAGTAGSRTAGGTRNV